MKIDPRQVVLAGVLSVFFLSILLFGSSFWIVIILAIVWIIFFIWFVYNGIREVPASPPHVGVLTILKGRRKVVIKEGYRFFPFYPWISSFIAVKIEKINQDLPEQVIRTPDRAEVGIEVSITWQPDYHRAENLISFLNSGGKENVENILEDIIQDRLRSWALSGVEGPSNWQEAMASPDEAVAVLLKAILGDVLDPVPYFPTSALVKFFNLPQIPPSEIEKEKWGEDWEKLKNKFEGLDPAKQKEMKDKLEKRVKDIEAAKQGNGYFIKPSLGIILNRFTINQIRIKGDLSKYAETKAVQRQQREGEILELEHVKDRLRELQKEGISIEQAIQIVQVERKKATMNFDEKRFNITPETLRGIKEITKSIFS